MSAKPPADKPMYITTEDTPNQNALKFLPARPISQEPCFFASLQDASSSALARKLLAVRGVDAVFFGSDFITVTKAQDMDWDLLKPSIFYAISDHFLAGLEVYDGVAAPEIDLSQLTDIERQIVEVINDKVRPAVAMDGGDIVYRSFQDGIVTVRLHGACKGCPSSAITLKNGIESMLQYYVPEVIAVEAEDEEEMALN